jgi:hypothetical protein
MDFPRFEKQRLEKQRLKENRLEKQKLSRTSALQIHLETARRARQTGYFIARINNECKHFLRQLG